MKANLFTAKHRSFLAVLALATWVAAPVWGDDTEIFFGGTSVEGVRPNVLFIMDTSGSMSSRPSGSASGTPSKINIVKDALKQLVTEVNEVNIGLMRFSNPGGPVIYPVTYIENKVGFDPGAPVQVLSDVSQDGQENLTDNSVVLDGVELSMGTGGTGGAAAPPIVRAVTGSYDDVYQYYGSNGNGGMDRFDNLCIGGQGNNCDRQGNGDDADDPSRSWLMAMRWPNLPVPKGAIVTEAILEVESVRASNRNVIVDTYAAVPPFNDFNNSDTIFDRARLPAPPVRWNLQDNGGNRPSNGENIFSPNFAPLVQAAVDDTGWGSTGGDLGLIFELDLDDSDRRGRRQLEDSSDNRDPPTLTVRYEVPSVGPSDTYLSALKFDSVGIPLGVTVTSAKLVLTPTATTGVASDVTVTLQDAAAPADLSTSPGDLSARLGGAPSTTISLSASDWQNNVPVELDVTGLVNPRVNQSGWCGGDPLVFLLGSTGATRLFAASEAGGSRAARLEVEYAPDTLVPGSSCRNISYTRQVTASEDDGQTNGSAVSSDATIAIGASGSGVFRFTSLQIPNSADVSEAYLTVTADQDAAGSADFLISVENVGDSPAIDVNGIAGRSFVGSIPWSVSNDWTADTGYRSPNIKALVDRALSNGLSEGDAMTLKLDFSAGAGRAIKAFEQGQLTSATLRVVFEDDGSLGANTVREEFARAVDSLSASGYTPIQDTLFEAYQYYKGEEVVWGKFRGGHEADGSLITYGAAEDGPFTYARTSVEGSITPSSWGGNQLPSGCPGPDSSDGDCNDSNGSGQPQGEYLLGNPIYQSPINDQCQAESHIVFLTDGLANEPHSRSLIESVIGTTSCPSSTRSSEACTAELAGWMQNNDMSDLPGEQKVTTHTVGFDNDDPFLETIATLGGGEYKQANDLNSLVAEFRAILASVLKTNTSFVAPVAAINQFNRLTNLDEVYFAVFRPDSVPKWSGNLKRYKLASVGGADNVLVDVNGNPAVNSNTGFFETSAQSYWSSSADGAEVEEGGAAENLPSYADGGRKIYSNISGSTNAVLSNAANGVRVGNGSLTDTMLGVTSAERDDHVRWIRGQDVDDEDADSVTNEARYAFGDPLHSRPVAVNYGSASTSDVTLYFGTNAGFLHAIDADTGAEEFSFLPKELFGLQEELRANDSADDHYYGIDGSPAVWTDEGSTPGFGNDGADFVRLYIGQRRGGRNYYALDVTDRANPKLMWKITGGSTTGFGELGQTWGRPIPGVLNVGGTKTDVLYISGGYDPAKDGTTLRATDSMGRAIYIVNALDGSLIWSGGFSGGSFTKTFAGMDYSIPATLTVIDVDNDGLDDGIYVGDTGGQVWRFDIKNGAAAADLISGGVIARFGATGATDPAANRMFYHSPDVALIDIEGVRKLAVTIGSGARPSPLSEFAEDRFYTIFQSTVYGAPSSYVTLTESSDFYDATSNLLQTGTDAEVEAAELALAGASGWFIDFSRSGEKVLSTPLSFRNTVTFTTYTPDNVVGSCVPKAGTSRIYQMSLTDATPVNLWADTDPDADPVREFELKTPSIIDEPVIICTGDGCDLFVGPEQPPIDTLEGGNIIRAYWRQDN